MTRFVELLAHFGNTVFEILLLPLVIWTLISLVIRTVLKLTANPHPIYKYHSVIALLFSLPLGVLVSQLTNFQLLNTSAGLSSISGIFVIQNPVPEVAIIASAGNSILIFPLIMGVLALLICFVSIIYLTNIVLACRSLASFYENLEVLPVSRLDSLSEANQTFLNNKPVKIAFSPEIEVPFTFGWINKTVALPMILKGNPQKLNMALRHELIHVKHYDYLLNLVLMIIKALFWFHPLVHLLYKDFKKYREMACDYQVLGDKNIPKKKYAELLLELTSKQHYGGSAAITMSVNPSNLEQRINNISSSKRNQRNIFTLSFCFMLLSTSLITGVMACSKLEPGEEIADNKSTENEILRVAEIMPVMQGGLTQLQDCIGYPSEALEKKTEGRLLVQFVVNEQGEVNNPKIIKSLGAGTDQEVLRCIEQQKFAPAVNNGKPVKVQYSLPIVFKV